jgi:hypothetical protein
MAQAKMAGILFVRLAETRKSDLGQNLSIVLQDFLKGEDNDGRWNILLRKM